MSSEPADDSIAAAARRAEASIHWLVCADCGKEFSRLLAGGVCAACGRATHERAKEGRARQWSEQYRRKWSWLDD